MPTGTFSLPDIYLAAQQAKGMQQQQKMNDMGMRQARSNAQIQDIINLGRVSEQIMNSPDPVSFYNEHLPQIRGAISSPEILERLNPTNDPNEILTEAQQIAQLARSFMEQAPQSRLISGDEAVSLGFSPGTVVQQTGNEYDVLQSEKSPLVTVDNRQGNAESAAYGKLLVENFAKIQERANNASDELAQWQTLQAFDIPMGSGEEAKLFLRDHAAKVANVMGIEVGPELIGRISDAKSYKAVTMDLLRKRLSSQKGPQTEGDAARMLKTLSQIENPKEANEFISRSNIALIRREMEQAEFYQRWRDEKGTFEGAASAWNKFKSETPLVAQNPNTKKPVFYTDFMEVFLAANQNATREDALKVWREKYGR